METSSSVWPPNSYQRGKGGDGVTKRGVKVGERVTVVGHKLPGGEFAATEVLVLDRESSSANQDAKDPFDLGGYDSPIR